MTSIPDFYAGRTVFITGATGFMGKVLVEKLLRSCPAIKTIYILVRPKKGSTPHQRVEDLLKSKLFDKVRNEDPNFNEKVIAVSGDILEENLGISESDKETLINEVSIVFHSAATVKFDEHLKLSVQMNVIGVKSMLTLAKQIKKLDSFLHVSTAYANCDKGTVKELVYPPPINPQKIVDAVEWMDNDAMDILTPRLVHPRPNTYTFTKALAEHVVITERESIPTAIVRPSIVGASWMEPFAGWVDNFNGPTGLLAAIGKGVLRSMKGDYHAKADIIPVDIATNLMIAVAWYTAMERPSEVTVYNCVSGQGNPTSWGDIERASYDAFMKNPVDNMIRIPNPRFTTSTLWHNLCRWFDHRLPAFLLDTYMRIVGKRPMFMRIQERIWRSVATLEYFTTQEWEFENENMRALDAKLEPEDRKTFNFEVKRIHWPTYIENYCVGTKVYALKEDMANMPSARKHVQRLLLRNRIVNITCIILFWRFLFSRFTMVRKLWYFFFKVAVGMFKIIPGFAKAS